MFKYLDYFAYMCEFWIWENLGEASALTLPLKHYINIFSKAEIGPCVSRVAGPGGGGGGGGGGAPASQLFFCFSV